jgi:3-oxoadipate enol-lactonase
MRVVLTPDQTYFVRCGSGARLLLIQGVAATHRHWGGRLLDALATSFDVVAYDHRGTGGSAPVTGPFTLTDLTDDTAALLDSLGWPTAHVAGVSMGGLVAQTLAIRYPQRVDSLFLGCSSTGGAKAISGALTSAIVRGDALATTRNLFRLGVKDPDAFSSPAWAEYHRAAFTEPVHPRTTTLQIAAVQAHSTAGDLHRITTPVHVAHGDTDRFVAFTDGKRLAAGIPGATLTRLAAGHFFWLEDPGRTADLIVRSAAASRSAGTADGFAVERLV